MRRGLGPALAAFSLLAIPSFLSSNLRLHPNHQTQAAVTLNNQDILDLLKAGLSPEIIVAKIKSSECKFDTSPSALKEMKARGIPDSVILAMIEISPKTNAESKPATTPVPLTADEIADREKRQQYCASCPSISIAYVEPATGKLTLNWLSKHQLEFLKKKSEEVKEGKIPPTLWLTLYARNADYLVIWTQAQGYRPYVYYTPHTETEMGSVSGNYNTFGSGGYEYGNFDGTVNVTRTYYTKQTGQVGFVDVTLEVYSAKTGQKVYGTWHRGNWRWSKPDQDCLRDVIKYFSPAEH